MKIENDLAVLPSHDRDSTSPNHLATITFFSSNPTSGVLLWTIDSSQDFLWAVKRDVDLELSCSQVHCLH